VGAFVALGAGCGKSAHSPIEPSAATFPAGAPAPIAPPPTLQVTKFMAFGDSLTEGEWWPGIPQVQTYDPTKSYPAWLLQSLQTRYTTQEFVVTNLGNGGNKATDDTGRFSQSLAIHNPQVVLLLEGLNDLQLDQHSSTIGEVAQALQTNIRNAKQRGAAVFISTLTATRHATPGYVPPHGDIYVPKSWFADDPTLLLAMNNAIRIVAANEGATLVDGYAITAANPTLYVGADGVHLSIEGYQALAAGFFEAIKANYETESPQPQWSKGPSIPAVGADVKVRAERPW